MWSDRAHTGAASLTYARTMKWAWIVLVLVGCWSERSRPVATNTTPSPAVTITLPQPQPLAWKTQGSTGFVAPNQSTSSPGPLSTNHAAYDEPAGCASCHDTNGPTLTTPSIQCLGCHDALLASPPPTQRGLHGDPTLLGKQCVVCHGEHRNRSYDILGWKTQPGGAAGFDHARTGWQLPPKYRAFACSTCHSTTNTQGLRIYRGLDRSQFSPES